MMMMATMTMAITGPLPASENRTVSLTAISCWELFLQAHHYTRHLSVKLEYAILG